MRVAFSSKFFFFGCWWPHHTYYGELCGISSFRAFQRHFCRNIIEFMSREHDNNIINVPLIDIAPQHICGMVIWQFYFSHTNLLNLIDSYSNLIYWNSFGKLLPLNPKPLFFYASNECIDFYRNSHTISVPFIFITFSKQKNNCSLRGRQYVINCIILI